MSHHPYFSPSAFKYTSQCPGRAVLSADIEDTAGYAANYGTVAHWIAAYCLNNDFQSAADYRDCFGYTHECNEDGKDLSGVVVDDKMLTYVDYYLQYARRRMEGALMTWVEERVLFGQYFGVDPEAGGTADLIVLDGTLLEVIDLKTGGIEVKAEENPQLALYAVGALEVAQHVANIERVRMTIVQPPHDSIDSWELPLTQFDAWVEKNVAPGISDIEAAVADFPQPDPDNEYREINKDIWNQNYLRPSNDACHFCRAKNICPALAAEVNEAAAAAGELADLAGVAGEVLGDMTTERLAKLLNAAPRIESFLRDLRGECERRLLRSEMVPGWKLVQGRQGPRSWTDEKAVEEMLKKTFRLKNDVMYNFKLISPTQAEKVFKNSSKRWRTLQAFVTRSEGQVSIAPETDERPAHVASNGAEAFDVFDAMMADEVQ